MRKIVLEDNTDVSDKLTMHANYTVLNLASFLVNTTYIKFDESIKAKIDLDQVMDTAEDMIDDILKRALANWKDDEGFRLKLTALFIDYTGLASIVNTDEFKRHIN